MSKRRKGALAAAAAAAVFLSVAATQPACSRRALDPTATPTSPGAAPPTSGTPVLNLSVRVTYTLSEALSTYPVAVWVETSSGAYLRTLGAYPGSFNYSPGYVLPTWWSKFQGRSEAVPPLPARAPGTYEHVWDLVDHSGVPQGVAVYRFRIETSNWGALWTDESLEASTVVSSSTQGLRLTVPGAGPYWTSLAIEIY